MSIVACLLAQTQKQVVFDLLSSLKKVPYCCEHVVWVFCCSREFFFSCCRSPKKYHNITARGCCWCIFVHKAVTCGKWLGLEQEPQWKTNYQRLKTIYPKSPEWWQNKTPGKSSLHFHSRSNTITANCKNLNCTFQSEDPASSKNHNHSQKITGNTRLLQAIATRFCSSNWCRCVTACEFRDSKNVSCHVCAQKSSNDLSCWCAFTFHIPFHIPLDFARLF
jgi:hypothetical protein